MKQASESTTTANEGTHLAFSRNGRDAYESNLKAIDDTAEELESLSILVGCAGRDLAGSSVNPVLWSGLETMIFGKARDLMHISHDLYAIARETPTPAEDGGEQFSGYDKTFLKGINSMVRRRIAAMGVELSGADWSDEVTRLGAIYIELFENEVLNSPTVMQALDAMRERQGMNRDSGEEAGVLPPASPLHAARTETVCRLLADGYSLRQIQGILQLNNQGMTKLLRAMPDIADPNAPEFGATA